MPIDASIPLQVKPPQFQNPLELYAQQVQMREAENRNAFAQYQMRKAQEEEARMSQVDQAWTASGGDRSKYLSAIPGRMVPDAMKKFGDADKQKAEIDEKQAAVTKHRLELFGGALVAAMQDPSDAVLTQHFMALKAAGVPIDDIAKNMLAIPDLEQRRQQIKSFAFGSDVGRKALEAIQPKAEKIDSGSAVGFVNTNPLGGPVGAQIGGSIQKTMTPGEVATDRRSAITQGETARHNRASEANAASGLTNQTTTNEGKLRDDYNQASKTFVTVRDAHQRVLASADQPSAAGDLALIFNYMKVLDPGSTVREGEFATAQNAGGIDDRTRALWNRVINGERLSDKIRSDFVNRSQKLYGAAESNQMETEKQYEGIATRGRMNPENVIVKSRTKEQPKAKEQTFSAMPDPAKYKGRLIEAEDGTRYRSDGSKWMKQ